MQAVYLEKLSDELSHRGLEAWLMAPPGRRPSLYVVNPAARAQPRVADRDQAEVGPGHAVLEVGRQPGRAGRVVYPEGQLIGGLRGPGHGASCGDHRGQRVAGLVVAGPVPFGRGLAAPGQVRTRHPVAE